MPRKIPFIFQAAHRRLQRGHVFRLLSTRTRNTA